MMKRGLGDEAAAHIGPDDSAQRGTEGATLTNASQFRLCNFVKATKKKKIEKDNTTPPKMEVALSRKSTSDEDELASRAMLDKMDAWKRANASQEADAPTIPDENGMLTAISSPERHGPKAETQTMWAIEDKPASQEAPAATVKVKTEHPARGVNSQEDNGTEHVTPSRRADYVHTLLSGRTSLENSISILNKIKSQIDDPVETPEEAPEPVAEEHEDANESQPSDKPASEDETLSIPSEKCEAELSSNESSLRESPDDEPGDADAEPKVLEEVDKLIARYGSLYNSIFFKNEGGNGKVRVVVRCSPTASKDRVVECGGGCIKLMKPGDKNSVFKSQRPKVYEFNFDHIVREHESTEQLYHGSCRDVVDKVLAGTSVTVFAYGSTGSGKTHTIAGNESSRGLIYLVMRDLFNAGKQGVHISYFEVYNENVYDLLQECERNLQIQENNNVVFVKGLTRVKVSSYEEFAKLFELGNGNRKVFTTNANRSSSRSHAILQVATAAGAKLTFIDLAGSERMKITENRGERLKESSYINKSLLALINCINTLAKNSNFMSHARAVNGAGQEGGFLCDRVKYRDSKLTHLLKNSLASNCLIVMIAHVNPENKFYQDSYNTIKYALRAKNVEITKVLARGKAGKEITKRFSHELLFLIGLMRSQMNAEQLELVRAHVAQSRLVGQAILTALLH